MEGTMKEEIKKSKVKKLTDAKARSLKSFS
jgi:hypothetical protein